MDNRNTPRSRKDSVTDKERRSMQQGYPVRENANRTPDISANRPEGPREVPQSMRQGKIPVRENAATGRTIPVMNRSGQPLSKAPAETPETTPSPVTDMEQEFLQRTLSAEIPADVPDTEETENIFIEETPDDTSDAVVPEEQESPEEAANTPEAAEPEPVSVENTEDEQISFNITEAEAIPVETTENEAAHEDTVEPEDAIEEEAVSEETTEETEPDTGETETADTVEPAADPEISEPATEASPAADENPAATEKAEEIAPAAPSAAEPEEPACEEEHDPDEELLLILNRRRKTQTEEPEVPSAPEEQPADIPDETAGEAETAKSPDEEITETPDNGSKKKLWILPLAAAVLVSLAMLIGIPAFFTPAETVPDFDMTLSYGNALQGTETGALDETSGVGRDDPTETNSQPPETSPQAVKFNVTLDFFDRDPLTVSTSEITLEALLKRVNYVILESDRFSVDLSTLLTEETIITVDTVTYGTATETITIPFEVKTTNVQTIPRGQRNVTQYGKDGSKTITYTTEIVNGVEASRTVAKEEITLQPVTETCQVGIGGTLVGNDGKTYSYSYYRMVNATYYDIEGLTYLGYEADESVVAVDMDYIPLGTKIYVKNDQFDFGVRVAADTGSMIEGWEVDIWLDDSNPQKKDFAYIGYVKNMIIYYLD